MGIPYRTVRSSAKELISNSGKYCNRHALSFNLRTTVGLSYQSIRDKYHTYRLHSPQDNGRFLPFLGAPSAFPSVSECTPEGPGTGMVYGLMPTSMSLTCRGRFGGRGSPSRGSMRTPLVMVSGLGGGDGGVEAGTKPKAQVRFCRIYSDAFPTKYFVRRL